MEQRSPEWFAMRLGKVTASRIADVMAKTKTGPAATRLAYHKQLFNERMTGEVKKSFSNDAMQWGTETEPQARAAYEFLVGCDVVEIAFVDHPTIPNAGASPDGLVGDDGMVEIKCPETYTHCKTIRGAPIERRYILQMQFQMACAGRDWCDFVSFDPRVNTAIQFYRARVMRDPELIAEIEASVAEFLAGVDAEVNETKALYEEAA